MPRMIVSLDSVVIKELQLTKERTTLGRRPYNDIVIDDLAVSGEHAVFQMTATEVYFEDLHSTNGSFVNGKAVKKQLLQHGDVVAVGKYQLNFVSDAGVVPVSVPPSPVMPDAAGVTPVSALIKVLSGSAAGRELPLTKEVTTVGKPAVAVAAIIRRQQGFAIHHIEGSAYPVLNGVLIGADPVSLKNEDLIELAGTQMQFIQV